MSGRGSVTTCCDGTGLNGVHSAGNPIESVRARKWQPVSSCCGDNPTLTLSGNATAAHQKQQTLLSTSGDPIRHPGDVKQQLPENTVRSRQK